MGRRFKRLPMSLADRPTGYTAARVVKTAEDIAIREEIVSMMNGRFVIPAEEVSELIKRRNVSIDAILTHLIQPASALARPPISKYHVGAAGVAGSGTIYIGVNLELLHSPLNHSIHAEQFLAVNLVKAREERLVTLAVSAAPCGHCRQFFAELAYAGEVRFLFGDQAPLEARTLDDLLPLRFGPQGDSEFPHFYCHLSYPSAMSFGCVKILLGLMVASFFNLSIMISS